MSSPSEKKICPHNSKGSILYKIVKNKFIPMNIIIPWCQHIYLQVNPWYQVHDEVDLTTP